MLNTILQQILHLTLLHLKSCALTCRHLFYALWKYTDCWLRRNNLASQPLPNKNKFRSLTFKDLNRFLSFLLMTEHFSCQPWTETHPSILYGLGVHFRISRAPVNNDGACIPTKSCLYFLAKTSNRVNSEPVFTKVLPGERLDTFRWTKLIVNTLNHASNSKRAFWCSLTYFGACE